MEAVSALSFESCQRYSDDILASAYDRLPSGYFQEKSAGTYLFNNITRLIETFPEVSLEDPEAVSKTITRQLAAHDTSSIYIGVPWCEQICSFCNFAYSTSKNDDERKAHLDLLFKELVILRQCGLSGRKVNSVYFGGGTPTVLSDELFDGYLKSMLGVLNLVQGASVTCEATVSTLTRQKLELMRRNGVTRLSMGIQSLDDKVREQAKLLRTGEEAIEAVQLAREYFDMFNVDLIYGYPYQSQESWFDTVTRVAALNLPSITLYRLEVKERTANLKLFERQLDAFKDELSSRRQYFIGRKVLEAHGYVEQPLGWWIRKDKNELSRTWKQHMSGWARAIPYFGLGQGAFSLCESAYLENHKTARHWKEDLARGASPVASLRVFDERVPLLNRILRVLRTAHGIDLASVEQELRACQLYEPFADLMERNASWGLLERKGGEYMLNDGGRSLIHWILDEIVRLPESVVV